MQLSIFKSIIHVGLNEFEAMGLYGTMDWKSNQNGHCENNFKRTLNCPATRANETSTQKVCGVGAETILNGWS